VNARSTISLSLPSETVDELVDLLTLVRSLRIELHPFDCFRPLVDTQTRHLTVCNDVKIPVAKVCFREVREQLERPLRDLALVALRQRLDKLLVVKLIAREAPFECLLVDHDANRITESAVGELQRFTVEVKSRELHVNGRPIPETVNVDVCHTQRDGDFGKSV